MAQEIANEQQKREHEEFAKGLHEAADFIAAHPEAHLPYNQLNIFTYDRPVFLKTLRAMVQSGRDVTQKTDEPGTFPYHHASIQFGPVTLNISVPVGQVGKKTLRSRQVEVCEVEEDILLGRFKDPAPAAERNAQVSEPLRSVVNAISPEVGG